jgi:enoyl-CoA hydratase/carnithine racemase
LTTGQLETLHVLCDAGVVRATFTRPAALNAFNETMEAELSRLCEEIAGDESVRVLVFDGADGNFMSGADITMLERWAAAAEPVEELMDGLFTPTVLEQLPQPVVAAVDGYAFGMGLEVALASDFRILTDRAMLGLPEIRLGVLPGAGGTQRLARLVGRTRASEMVMADTRITAEEALDWGLAGRVVPVEGLEEAVSVLLKRLLSLGPLALRNAKAALLAAGTMPLVDGLAAERRLFAELVRTQDAREGITAFLEKRRPAFAGR